MEFLTPVFDALQYGAEHILGILVGLALAAATVASVAIRNAVAKGVPAWLQPVVAGLAEQYLQPIAENAVRQAEEWAQRQIDKGLAAAQTLSAEKLAVAKAYVLKAAPDVIISDARLESLIDAALVKVGLGAAGAIRVGVEVLGEKLETVEQHLPPAA